MKANFKFLVVALAVVSPMLLMAKNTVPIDPDFERPAFFAFILQFAIAAFVGVWSDAWKWVGSNEWDWSVFWDSILLPFLLAVLGGVGLTALDYYGGDFKSYFFIVEGSDGFSFNYLTLYSAGYAFALGLKKIIDRFKG